MYICSCFGFPRNAAVLGTKDVYVVINTTLDGTGTSGCGAGFMRTMAAQSVSQLESNPDLSHQQFVCGYSTTK